VDWHKGRAETPPNSFGAQVLQFHPNTEYLIWVGNKDCTGGGTCHAEAHYSRDNGRKWAYIDSFVRNCAFAKDKQLDADPSEIVCEVYRDKKAPQPKRPGGPNPMELIVGSNFYADKRKMFDSVVGFAKFSEFFVVAEVRSLIYGCWTLTKGGILDDPVADGFGVAGFDGRQALQFRQIPAIYAS
jgi:hypothetical protein